jgi:hypothetical protein
MEREKKKKSGMTSLNLATTKPTTDYVLHREHTINNQGGEERGFSWFRDPEMGNYKVKSVPDQGTFRMHLED